MPPPPPKLKLYMDVVSPFGYIAYWILRHDPVFAHCEITYVPMFLGGVMRACGNTPPINIKNKDKWIATERNRWRVAFNVPMKSDVPEGFPPLTLLTMRALCVVDETCGQDVLIKALDEVLQAFWVEHRKVWEKDGLVEVLTSVLGEEGCVSVIEKVGKEGKDVLTRNTDLAFKDGAFGLPWFVATNAEGKVESFWGVDHLAQVAIHLGLERPAMNSAGAGGWKALL